jgi:hypothetical protein
MLLEEDISKLSAKKGNFRFLLDLGDFMILSAARKLQMVSCIIYG